MSLGNGFFDAMLSNQRAELPATGRHSAERS
jgi:hypothetical protein